MRWILLRSVNELDADERTHRQALCQGSAALATAQALAHDFSRIVRAPAKTELGAWLTAGARSHISELVRFARGPRRFLFAVHSRAD
jgi:hypothetical protein